MEFELSNSFVKSADSLNVKSEPEVLEEGR
jgi:hypothetical protein